jgi:hypothetical protein
MAKTQKTPRPQKSSAKAKAVVNKMKGAAITATPPSDESDEAKVKGETSVGDHPEVEQNNQAAHSVLGNSDKSSGDDDTVTGIRSLMEAAAAVVYLSGVARTITAASTNAPKKPRRRNLVHSRENCRPLRRRNLPPQVMTMHFGYVFQNSAGKRMIMAQQVSPVQKMIQTMYLRIGSIISGRGTQIM